MVNDIRPTGKRPVKRVAIKPANVKHEDEPVFIPPESLHETEDEPSKVIAEVAADGPLAKLPGFGREANNDKKKPSKRPHPLIWLKDKWLSLSKRGKIITVAAIVVLIGASAAAAIIFWPKKTPPPPPPLPVVEKKVEEPPKPTTEASNLTGLQVGFEVNKRPVTGVMIENSPDARPQSGLTDAGVVFEAVAEGGITRFLALFQDTTPAYVGPVRSARLYYVHWLMGFDANYAHVGGSPTGLLEITNQNIKDMNQFYNSSAYDRVTSRYAPHNVYTSLDRLIALGASKGYTTSKYTPLARKAEKKLDTPTASSIGIEISSPLYNVHYTYDTANNAYLRSEGGQAHTDEKSGKQIEPKVVVVLVTDKGYESDGLHSTYRTTGTGQVFVFQDGGVTPGTWNRADDRSQYQFKDSAGNDLKLNAGQTWITAVGNASSVSYAP